MTAVQEQLGQRREEQEKQGEMAVEQEMQVAQKKGADQEQRREWVVSREEEVEKKQTSKAEGRQRREEVAALEGWRREPQRELSQDESGTKWIIRRTGGDEIGSVRETFEPRKIEKTKEVKERRTSNGGKTRTR